MTDNALTVTLPSETWQKVIQAMRNEAYTLSRESDRACEKGANEYGEILWEECAEHNEIAREIETQTGLEWWKD